MTESEPTGDTLQRNTSKLLEHLVPQVLRWLRQCVTLVHTQKSTAQKMPDKHLAPGAWLNGVKPQRGRLARSAKPSVSPMQVHRVYLFELRPLRKYKTLIFILSDKTRGIAIAERVESLPAGAGRG